MGWWGCQENPYSQGQVIYNYYCGNCHMEDGSGLGKLIPSLDSSRLTLSDPQKLVCLILKGLPVNPETGQSMPANTALNEVELTNLINFLGDKYAFTPQAVQVEEVKKMLAGCHSD
jgi:mono/diheme cytochrome c family protein